MALPNEKAQKNDWEITVPNGLGYVLEFKQKLSEPVLGLKEWKPEDRPRMVGLIYYSFRIMSGIGFFFVGLMLFSIIQWMRGKLSAENIAQQTWLMRAWILAAPLGYIAVESGWIVRCVGRQPWALYGQIRTADAASVIPASNVLTSLSFFAVVYSFLFVCALYFGSRIIRKGPNLNLPVPGLDNQPAIETEPAEHIPDSRPAEAQQ
jgi:cytochrome d ubiquinol oxidase subunit I